MASEIMQRVRRVVRVTEQARMHSKLWGYSYGDLADLFGLTASSVRQAVARSQFDPASLRSVCGYWAAGAAPEMIRGVPRRRRIEPVKLNAEEFIELRGQGTVSAWKRRWPRFDVYRCGAAACREVLLEPGYCRDHGSERPLITLSDDDHFLVWLGRRYVPICQVIFGSNHPVQVHHVDDNTWNSHPDNLVLFDGSTIRTKRTQWSYGYRELGNLFGLSEEAVRQAASRGTLDPASLSNICSFWTLRHS